MLNSAWKNAGSFTCSLPGIRFTSLTTPFTKTTTWLRIFPAWVWTAMEQLHKFTIWLERLQNYYNVKWGRHFLFQDVLQKVKMCALPCAEWGMESPSHFSFRCNKDIFGPPINKWGLFKDILTEEDLHTVYVTHQNCDLQLIAYCSLLLYFLQPASDCIKMLLLLHLILHVFHATGNTDRNLFQLSSQARVNIKVILPCCYSQSPAGHTYEGHV